MKNLLLGAIVATMTLTACEKSEETGNPIDQMPKSVTITLPNINTTTRATGDAMGASEVPLKNFQILFLDADGNVQTVPQYDEKTQKTFFTSENPDDWTDITSATKRSFTYHFLPAATTQVVVIGNLGEITKDTYNSTVVEKMHDVLNDDESGHPLYPLYGESNLTLKAGAETEVNTHTNVYTANVTLAPKVARLEVYGFQYSKEAADANYDFHHLVLDKIALSNYSTTYNLKSGDAAEVAAAAKCPSTETDAALIWDWIAAAQSPWANTLNNNLAQDAKVFVDGTEIPADNTDGTGAQGIITFGLAKSKSAAENPELLLSFYGAADNTPETELTPLYLRAKFTHVDAFVPGKIYRVLYPIVDGSWKQPERCVELTVTVADWEIIAVAPEF